jgi:hypothetical protein
MKVFDLAKKVQSKKIETIPILEKYFKKVDF